MSLIRVYSSCICYISVFFLTTQAQKKCSKKMKKLQTHFFQIYQYFVPINIFPLNYLQKRKPIIQKRASPIKMIQLYNPSPKFLSK